MDPFEAAHCEHLKRHGYALILNLVATEVVDTIYAKAIDCLRTYVSMSNSATRCSTKNELLCAELQSEKAIALKIRS